MLVEVVVVGVKERMVIGEEGAPHGVVVTEMGRTARGWKGGEGRVERPVPPIMAMGTGSAGVLVPGRGGEGRGNLPG